MGRGPYPTICIPHLHAFLSIMTTILSRSAQGAWNHLAGCINPFNPHLHTFLSMPPTTLAPLQVAIVQQEVLRQAQMLSYIDGFWALGGVFVITTGILLIAKKF